MSDDGKWNEATAYATVREIVAQNPHLLQSVISGATAGYELRLNELREELSWANMAHGFALSLALGERQSAGTKQMSEQALRQRLLRFNARNGIENKFLAQTEPTIPASQEPQHAR